MDLGLAIFHQAWFHVEPGELNDLAEDLAAQPGSLAHISLNLWAPLHWLRRQGLELQQILDIALVIRMTPPPATAATVTAILITTSLRPPPPATSTATPITITIPITPATFATATSFPAALPAWRPSILILLEPRLRCLVDLGDSDLYPPVDPLSALGHHFVFERRARHTEDIARFNGCLSRGTAFECRFTHDWLRISPADGRCRQQGSRSLQAGSAFVDNQLLEDRQDAVK
jgi:hypothetical protein